LYLLPPQRLFPGGGEPPEGEFGGVSFEIRPERRREDTSFRPRVNPLRAAFRRVPPAACSGAGPR